jgi:purine nucleosidase
MPTRIILDIDNATGMAARDVDDGLALTMALASGDFDLLGVTTCSGNCYARESTDITLRMLELAGRTDIPVGAGRDMPMLLDVGPHFQRLAQASAAAAAGWHGAVALPPASGSITPVPAYRLIIDMVRRYPGEVVIVKEGALTNLAVALLVDPGIAPLVKGVVHMGGSIEPWWESYLGRMDPEMWRHVIKLNTVYDPEATAIVMKSGIPMTYVTINVCSRVRLRPADTDRIAAVGGPYHAFLADASRRWVDYVDYQDGSEGAAMWDLLTLALVAHPEFCECVTMRQDADRFRADRYPWLYASSDGPQAQVTVGVDVAAFEAYLMRSLTTPIPAAGPRG